MIKHVGFIIVIALLTSCGSYSSFTKQKYTNLRQIKPKKERLTSANVQKPTDEKTKKLERIQPLFEQFRLDLNQTTKLDSPEVKLDTLSTSEKFKYAQRIKRGLRGKRRFIMDRDGIFYGLDQMSYNDSTGILYAKIISKGDMTFERYDQIIKVNGYAIENGSSISIADENILNYTEEDVEEDEVNIATENPQLTDEERQKKRSNNQIGAVATAAAGISILLVIGGVLFLVALAAFFLALIGGTLITGPVFLLIGILAGFAFLLIFLSVILAKKANDHKSKE